MFYTKKYLFSFSNSPVLRSHSFHSGAMQFGDFQLRQQFSEDNLNKVQWTIASTESSDEEEFDKNIRLLED